MRVFKKHNELQPHLRYQLEVIFLFTAGLLLFLPYYLAITKLLSYNIQTWQWSFFFPWMIFYVAYSLNMRNKIMPQEKIAPFKRPIVHWVVLGILIVFYHLQPIDIKRVVSIDLMFIIFSLFLADSYWDFKQIKL